MEVEMHTVGKVGKALISPIKAIGGLIKKPKQAALPKPLPTPLRDDARAIVERDDELRRRRGGASDIVNGLGGVEAAPTGGKTTLGQ
jgi:hypothetical protein